ncbi:MAG: hypothetical protein C0617_04865 [Desulfuromonas sp.]|uniref:esterase/lipase family protein n=1 Tax=Desulfuromonas sp. TaxID=892 RepID=UPI000CAF44A6|nr:hypothetical protein [Desulfuromonas sp.]PLX85222.1 MAG: hypothetical protein C0617_04865 [Desulfuromonas sp.]
MKQRVFLIHGWSVDETTTYQALHLQLARHGYALEDVYLGRYVSLEDRVEICDIARAMHTALDEKLGGDWSRPFHIVTHSTGALVARHWVGRHYSGAFCLHRPLRNLVFLAGPHFGSRLAHHGRSMLAHARYFGDTGEQVLKALELGSDFSWGLAESWFDPAVWRDKGVRPYCLTGDRVKKKRLVDEFAAKLLPAGFEPGSDMVVRVPAGNLNCRRYLLQAKNGTIHPAGEIEDVPFAALADYVHSGPEAGIMNSIKRRATSKGHRALGLILDCLKVEDDAGYARMRRRLAAETRRTRVEKKRPAFAQLDFRFRDEEGHPVNDYAIRLGWLDKGVEKPSRAIRHTHKNTVAPNHFSVFVETGKLDPKKTYFLDLQADSRSELFSYGPLRVETAKKIDVLKSLVRDDQTTQIDVVLSRKAGRKLFVFHPGDDPDLHVKWDRKGEIVGTGLRVK